LPWLVYFVVDS
ncbi:hypothetical protein VCHENC02_2986B, partial [Vibrio harveyi]